MHYNKWQQKFNEQYQQLLKQQHRHQPKYLANDQSHYNNNSDSSPNTQSQFLSVHVREVGENHPNRINEYARVYRGSRQQQQQQQTETEYHQTNDEDELPLFKIKLVKGFETTKTSTVYKLQSNNDGAASTEGIYSETPDAVLEENINETSRLGNQLIDDFNDSEFSPQIDIYNRREYTGSQKELTNKIYHDNDRIQEHTQQQDKISDVHEYNTTTPPTVLGKLYDIQKNYTITQLHNHNTIEDNINILEGFTDFFDSYYSSRI